MPGFEWQVEAYDHTPIPNRSDPDPEARVVALARQKLRTWLTRGDVHELRGPSGRFNCHGLVFASRRTNVGTLEDPEFDSNIDDLLHSDGYTLQSAPQAGDVAVYRWNGNVEHTGFVAYVDPALGTVFVWSAWNSLGEFLHPEKASPFHFCTVEYWRLR